MVPKEEGERGRDEDCDPVQASLEHLAAVDPDLAVIIRKPIRSRIVALGHQRLISPSEFAKEANISAREASGHFDALSDKDFIELVKEEKVRGTMRHLYRSTKRAYFSVIDWGKLGKTVQEGMGSAVLADFNHRVGDAFQEGTFQQRAESVLFWLAVMVDEESWPEFIGILTWAIKEVEELNVTTAQRHAEGKGKGELFPVTFQIAGFESPQVRRPKQEEGEPAPTPKKSKSKSKQKRKSKSKPKSKRKPAKKKEGGK